MYTNGNAAGRPLLKAYFTPSKYCVCFIHAVCPFSENKTGFLRLYMENKTSAKALELETECAQIHQ